MGAKASTPPPDGRRSDRDAVPRSWASWPPGPARRRQEHREPVLRPTAGAVAATGLVLAVAANIHGAALLIGIALGS
jgi:hypothetical protein